MTWKKTFSVIVAVLFQQSIPAYGQQQSEKIQGRMLNIDVDVVLADAIVTDPQGRYVTTLGREQFRLWEDKVEQRIEYFASEEIPVSVGIVFDVSASMQDKISVAQDAAMKFLQIGNRDDEYFLLEFGSRPEVSRDFTPNTTKLQNRVAVTTTSGNTALFDAIYVGMQKARTGRNPRKALLLITDGEDNWSAYTHSEVVPGCAIRHV